jgi:hypothetical protein
MTLARPTIGQLITRAHLMSDVPELSSARTNAFATQIEVLDVANDALAEMHDLLVEVWDDYLTKQDTSLVTSTTVQWVQLPKDFYKLIACFMIDSSTRVEMQPFDWLELGGVSTTDSSNRMRYRISGNRMVFDRLPSGVYTLELWYIPQFRPLADRNEVVGQYIHPGWESYVIYHVAAYLLAKEESDPTYAVTMKEQTRRRIESIAANRNAAKPKMVIDTEGKYRKKRPELPFPRVP